MRRGEQMVAAARLRGRPPYRSRYPPPYRRRYPPQRNYRGFDFDARPFPPRPPPRPRPPDLRWAQSELIATPRYGFFGGMSDFPFSYNANRRRFN